MSTAVALFGLYPNLPWAVRNHSRQPTFSGLHCMYIQRADASYRPPFLDEFTNEVSKVADCVPASCVRGVNFLSAGKQAPCTPAEREALQNAMGTQDQGADENEAAAGIQKRYGRSLQRGQSWQSIVAAIGGESVPVIIGDPLATSDQTGFTLGQLKAYADGLQDRYVLFPQAAQPAKPKYTLRAATGSHRIFRIPGGTTTPNKSRVITVTRVPYSPAPVSHGIPGHWRVEDGPDRYWYYIAGQSGAFTVVDANGKQVDIKS